MAANLMGTYVKEDPRAHFRDVPNRPPPNLCARRATWLPMSATQGALLTVAGDGPTAGKLVQSVFNIAGSGATTTYTYVQNYVWTPLGLPGGFTFTCDMAVDVTGKMLYITYGANFGKADITALLTPSGAGGTLAVTENTSPSGWPSGDCFQMVGPRLCGSPPPPLYEPT